MSFNPSRTKVQLRLAITRIKTLRQKKQHLSNTQKREIALLLESGKEESARIRVENVIREDYNMEAMEILELYCELLVARFGMLESVKHCDQSISESVNTIIYAAPRSEVKELMLVRDQLIAKFGKEFAVGAMENKNDVVNERIIQKLKISTPSEKLVNQYLLEIAKSYNVNWTYSDISDKIDLLGLNDSDPFSAVPPNVSAPVAQLPVVPQQQQKKESEVDILFPDVPTSSGKKGSGGAAGGGDNNLDDQQDELTRRFEMLRKKK